jgi:hypothetical protein
MAESGGDDASMLKFFRGLDVSGTNFQVRGKARERKRFLIAGLFSFFFLLSRNTWESERRVTRYQTDSRCRVTGKERMSADSTVSYLEIFVNLLPLPLSLSSLLSLSLSVTL